MTIAWDFGDGSTGTGATGSQTYTEVGSFIATLTVADGKVGSGSATITITVNEPPNVAPTCEITSPQNNSQFTAPARVTVTTDANDVDGSVSKVEFFLNNKKVGPDLTAPFSYTISLAKGSYTISVKATDNEGAVSAISQVSIIVNKKK